MLKSAALLLIALILTTAGCGESGPAMGKVTGTVTVDGKVPPKLMIVFVPKDGGQTSTATTNSEGKYELLGSSTKGAVVGLHTVSITTVREATAATTDFANLPSDSPEYAAQGDPSQYKAAAQWKELLPERYNTNSELVEEVKAGQNEINFDLKTK